MKKKVLIILCLLLFISVQSAFSVGLIFSDLIAKIQRATDFLQGTESFIQDKMSMINDLMNIEAQLREVASYFESQYNRFASIDWSNPSNILNNLTKELKNISSILTDMDNFVGMFANSTAELQNKIDKFEKNKDVTPEGATESIEEIMEGLRGGSGGGSGMEGLGGGSGGGSGNDDETETLTLPDGTKIELAILQTQEQILKGEKERLEEVSNELIKKRDELQKTLDDYMENYNDAEFNLLLQLPLLSLTRVLASHTPQSITDTMYEITNKNGDGSLSHIIEYYTGSTLSTDNPTWLNDLKIDGSSLQKLSKPSYCGFNYPAIEFILRSCFKLNNEGEQAKTEGQIEGYNRTTGNVIRGNSSYQKSPDSTYLTTTEAEELNKILILCEKGVEASLDQYNDLSKTYNEGYVAYTSYIGSITEAQKAVDVYTGQIINTFKELLSVKQALKENIENVRDTSFKAEEFTVSYESKIYDEMCKGKVIKISYIWNGKAVTEYTYEMDGYVFPPSGTKEFANDPVKWINEHPYGYTTLEIKKKEKAKDLSKENN